MPLKRIRRIQPYILCLSITLTWPIDAVGRELNGFDLKGSLLPENEIMQGGPKKDFEGEIREALNEDAEAFGYDSPEAFVATFSRSDMLWSEGGRKNLLVCQPSLPMYVRHGAAKELE